jgi:hypothetical protein
MGEKKGTGTICAQHRAPTEGWSGRSGKWCLSPFSLSRPSTGSRSVATQPIDGDGGHELSQGDFVPHFRHSPHPAAE